MDALSEGRGTEDGQADREELGEDSSDHDRLETVVGSHGDRDDLSLIAHLASNKQEGEEDPFGHTAAAEVLELFTGLLESLVLVVVVEVSAFFVLFLALFKLLLLEFIVVSEEFSRVRVDFIGSGPFHHRCFCFFFAEMRSFNFFFFST